MGELNPSGIFRNILQQSERGIGGLFVGFKTRLIHVGITVTIQFLVFDYVKRLWGVASDGIIIKIPTKNGITRFHLARGFVDNFIKKRIIIIPRIP